MTQSLGQPCEFYLRPGAPPAPLSLSRLLLGGLGVFVCPAARTRSIWRLPDRRGWRAQWIPMVKEASPTCRVLLVGTQKDWDPVDWTSQGSEARRKVSPSPTWPRSPRAACSILDAPGFLSARCAADIRPMPRARDTAASSSQRPPRRIGPTASAWRPSTRRRSLPLTPSAVTLFIRLQHQHPLQREHPLQRTSSWASKKS